MHGCNHEICRFFAPEPCLVLRAHSSSFSAVPPSALLSQDGCVLFQGGGGGVGPYQGTSEPAVAAGVGHPSPAAPHFSGQELGYAEGMGQEGTRLEGDEEIAAEEAIQVWDHPSTSPKNQSYCHEISVCVSVHVRVCVSIHVRVQMHALVGVGGGSRACRQNQGDQRAAVEGGAAQAAGG